MRKATSSKSRQEGGALIAYLIVALVVMATIATLAAYIVNNVRMGSRRQDYVNAIQFAQGGAAVCALEVQAAFTNSGTFLANLAANSAGAYAQNTSLSSGGTVVYQRAITSPFTNQSVLAQIWLTNASAPTSLKIIASATVGQVSQTAQVNLETEFGYGGAIISTHQGTATSAVAKSHAQNGNVVVDGSSKGTTLIDGGILANGAVASNRCSIDEIQQHLYSTSDQIPDYTNPGSDDQLFDFGRFVAVAKVSGNYYSNLTAFVNVAGSSSNYLEGVVAVDITKGTEFDLDTKNLPYGINVRGTLVFRFVNGTGKKGTWDPLDKIVNTTTMNINPANLTGVNFSNPSTYTTGYPPTYTNPAKKAYMWDISKAPYNEVNFGPNDDLPALMYNNAILDMHGNVNICGAVYSPSFMEIENKNDGQVQYFNGALIGGGGIYVENGKNATSVVSYDENALKQLATAGTKGKVITAVYHQ